MPEGSTVIFLDIRISFQYSVDGKKLSCQKPARFVQPFRRFDKTPTCDRQTQTDRHRHRAIASARASTASRGQRLIHFSSFTSHELNSDVNTFVCFRIILPVTYFPYHGLRGSASPVLTATGFVNGRWQFSTPHRIHTP